MSERPTAGSGVSRAAAAAPLRLAAARVRARPGRLVLAALGVAAATALGAGVLVGAVVAGDRSVGRAVEGLPVADRAIRVNRFGLPPDGGLTAIDRDAVRALALVAPQAPERSVLFRESRLGGPLVQLAGLDGLRRWVRVDAGRLPGPCRPARCEVLVVGGSLGRELRQPGLRVVPVGRATLRSALPLGFTQPLPAESPVAEYAAQRVPLLLTNGVAGVSGVPALSTIYRTYGWTLPLPTTLGSDDVDPLLGRLGRAEAALTAAGSDYALTAPEEPLLEARGSVRSAERRLVLVGGGAAALLLGFVLLAAGGLRGDLDAEWRRLERRGARRWQGWLLALAETLAVAVPGVILGVLAGALGGALVAHAAGDDAGGAVARALLSGRALLAAAVALVAAAAVLLVGLRPPATRLRIGPLGALDLAALAAAATLALALARGGVDVSAANGEVRADPLLALLPALAVLVAALVAARLLPPLARLAQRATRHGPLPLRLGTLSLARRPATAATAAAFLVACIGLAVFAAAYRDTLSRGQRDQAAFAVPTDVVVSEGSQLVRPLDAAPLQAWNALPGADAALGVLRLSGQAARADAGVAAPAVLGIPAAGLHRIALRRDDADRSAAELGRLLRPPRPVPLRGIALPAAATSLELDTRLDGGPIDLQAQVATRGGDVLPVPLPGPVVGGHWQGPIPAAARGGRLIALEATLPPTRHESGRPARGLLHLGALHARGPGALPRSPAGTASAARAACGRRARATWCATPSAPTAAPCCGCPSRPTRWCCRWRRATRWPTPPGLAARCRWWSATCRCGRAWWPACTASPPAPTAATARWWWPTRRRSRSSSTALRRGSACPGSCGSTPRPGGEAALLDALSRPPYASLDARCAGGGAARVGARPARARRRLQPGRRGAGRAAAGRRRRRAGHAGHAARGARRAARPRGAGRGAARRCAPCCGCVQRWSAPWAWCSAWSRGWRSRRSRPTWCASAPTSARRSRRWPGPAPGAAGPRPARRGPRRGAGRGGADAPGVRRARAGRAAPGAS